MRAATHCLASVTASAQARSLKRRTCDRFVLGSRAQVSEVVADERTSPTDKHTHKIAAHVSAYIHHVRTQLKQTIPKAIVHCLVRPRTRCLRGLQHPRTHITAVSMSAALPLPWVASTHECPACLLCLRRADVKTCSRQASCCAPTLL